MIKSIFLISLLILSLNGEKKVILLSSEMMEEAKSSLSSQHVQLSKDDLDIEQIGKQRIPKNNPVPKTIGDEFVPEKGFTFQDSSSRYYAEKTFQNGLKFMERGKGHGREGKIAAFKLFEEAANLGYTEAKKLTAFAQLFGDYNRWSTEEARQTFLELEKVGSPDSQLALGFMHATGIGMPKSDQAKALIYYMFSALGGNPLAQMAMGFRYNSGVGVPQNCESALSYYQKVAKTVIDDIHFMPGQTIQRIRLTDEMDPTINMQPGSAPLDNNLVEYYKLLADKGDVSAQLGLAQIYLSGGRGIQQNYELAFKYFSAAAEAGNSEAYARLGEMYLDGTAFTPQNDEIAFSYLLKAADKANPEAQATLGIMYLKGRGVRRNYDKAFKLLSNAAEKKNVDGQLFLGDMFYKGVPTNAGIRRDFKKAFHLFQLASQNGHILGYYNLAQMHATGTGVMRSCQHAVELFKSVAERGKWGDRLMEAYAAYKDGRHNEAAIKYMFMAELGYEVAQTNLAFILDREEATSLFQGSRQNILERAFVNWQRSANQEYPIARLKLGDYYYYGLGTERDHSLAFSNYKTAVDRHALSQAMFNLGYMHEVGEGITRDLYLAKRFYDQSMEQSADAYMPAKLALFKLSVIFYLEEFNKHHVIQYLEEKIGSHWDIVAMTVSVGLIAVVLFLKWRNN